MELYDGRNDKKEKRTDRTAFVVSAGKITANNDYLTVRMNGRGDHSLFYCIKGRIFYGDTLVKQGEYIVVPPDLPQKYAVYKNDGTVYYYMHFTGGNLSSLLTSLGIEEEKVKIAPSGTDELLKKICLHIREEGIISELKAESTALKLLVLCSESKGGMSEDNRDRIARVLEEMEHSYFLSYDAKRFARLAFVSESRFNHIFKEETGESPQRYYTLVRMENAKRLLEYTDKKINEISSAVGYDDPLYFGRLFKKLFSLSPKEYRKRV